MIENREYYSKPNGDAREHYTIAANQFSKFYLIGSEVCYRAAMFDPKGVRHALPPETTAEQLGTAILDALAKSRFIPPSHPDFAALFTERRAAEMGDDYDTELMRLAGAKPKPPFIVAQKG